MSILPELRARIGAHRLLDEVEKDLARVCGLETFKVHPEKDEPFRFVDFKGAPTSPKQSLLRHYDAAILRAQAFPALLTLMHDLDAWQRDLVCRGGTVRRTSTR